MEILIAIIGALLSGLFKIIGISMDSSAKTEAETARKETAAVLETTDAERRITDTVREVERAGVRPEDVFAPELPAL